MTTTVVNKYVESFDVYIGRPARHWTPEARVPEIWRWGNPFTIGRDGDRNTVIIKFAKWLTMSNDERAHWMREHIRELHGLRLGCFCKPNKCHGDVLAWAADALAKTPDFTDDFWIAYDNIWTRRCPEYAAITLEK